MKNTTVFTPSKKTLFAAVILIFTLSLTGCIGYLFGGKDYTDTINANWSFKIPDDAKYKEIYSADSGASFNGDGFRYHVFSYESADPIEELLSWKSTEDETVFHSSYSEAADSWLDSIGVEENMRPDYKACSYWYSSQADLSEIIVFRDEAKAMLYVVESFL